MEMERRILVPLDGSALAETVLPHAVAMAQATGSSLSLLRVVAPPADAERLVRPAEHVQSRIYLAGLADRLRATTGLVVRIDVLEGQPAARIVARAQEDPRIAMIAMATHGRSGVGRWVFGSVAEQVVRAAPAPVLLVRAHEQRAPASAKGAYRKIVVPLDGSAFADQALGDAVKLARSSDATLCLVSVVEGPGDSVVEPGDVAAAEVGIVPCWMLAERQAEQERIGNMLRHRARMLGANGSKVETVVAHGKPAEEILRVSAQEEAGLVVMATHGRSGLQRLWLGSVAMKVLQGAAMPLLLVPRTRPLKVRQGRTSTAKVEQSRWPAVPAAGRA